MKNLLIFILILIGSLCVSISAASIGAAGNKEPLIGLIGIFAFIFAFSIPCMYPNLDYKIKTKDNEVPE